VSQTESASIPMPQDPGPGLDDGFPRHFGAYALLSSFAQGGMGEVYLAKSGGVAGIDRLCVLKKLRSDVTQNDEYVRRFIDEARLVVQLNHAKICHVFDAGRVGREYFLAMEYVSGVNLRKLQNRSFSRSTSLPPEVVLYIARDFLEALDYAHRLAHPITGKPLKLVHRDVSPQNVMINYEGEVKLIDFGLAASELKEEQTESQVVMGKVAYMSPEQARGEDVCAKTDQFAAAVVTYELLAGERFYGDMSNYQIWQVVGKGTYLPPGLADFDNDLAALLKQALAPRRQDRFATCGDFVDAIDLYLAQTHPGNQQKKARQVMETLFDVDREAERRFLARFADVQVPGYEPGPDAISIAEPSGARNLILDDKSRPIPQQEAARLLRAGITDLAPELGALPSADASAEHTVDETLRVRRGEGSDTLAAQRAAFQPQNTALRAAMLAGAVALSGFGAYWFTRTPAPTKIATPAPSPSTTPSNGADVDTPKKPVEDVVAKTPNPEVTPPASSTTKKTQNTKTPQRAAQKTVEKKVARASTTPKKTPAPKADATAKSKTPLSTAKPVPDDKVASATPNKTPAPKLEGNAAEAHRLKTKLLKLAKEGNCAAQRLKLLNGRDIKPVQFDFMNVCIRKLEK